MEHPNIQPEPTLEEKDKDQYAAKKVLRPGAESYRLLVESAREYAIFMLDPEGRIATWNTGAERIFQYNEAEAIGLSGAAIFMTEDRAAGVPQAEMETALREGRANDERWHLRKDGSRFWASGMMEPLRDSNGQLHGFAKILRDNTQQKQMEEALRHLNETLEERVQERTKQVRALVTQLTRSEQAERHRIAQILHDELQQHLYALQFQLTFLRDAENAEDWEETLNTIDEIEETIVHAIQLTRDLSVDLSPSVLEGEGLAEAMRWLAAQMERRHGLTVQVQAVDDVPVPHGELRVLLFQMVREVLFNTVKHAGVSDAVIALDSADHHIQIEIMDRGKGFHVDEVLEDPERSHGLWQIRQRLELVGGCMEIVSSAASGTHTTLVCPLSHRNK